MERVYTTPRLDKLGVRPGARVAIVGVPDADLRIELACRTHDLTDGDPLPDTDPVALRGEARSTD